MEAQRAVKLFKWIREYPGWWYLICTPGEEHMNLNMMRQIISHLEQEGMYELIFVLITVHRQAPFMKNFYALMWLDALIDHWNEDYGKTIKGMMQRFV